MLVNRQLVASMAVGVFNPVMFYLDRFNILELFEWSACKLAG